MREIGRVAKLQVQRSRLKVGDKPNRVYDTSALVDARQLSVSPEGAQAILPNGQMVIDVHHVRHPASQNAVKNGVSVGFTPNYARMRERYGDHLWNGCAGENILIETSDSVTLDDLRHGLIVRCGASNAELRLGSIMIALPCLEFSRYSLRMPQAEKSSQAIKGALQFLDGGTRGYYVTPANHAAPLIVSLGDRVCVAE